MKSASFKAVSVAAFLGSIVVFGAAGCGDKKTPTRDYMPHMNDSSGVKAQRLGPFGEPMRTPPAGTVAVNSAHAYPYEQSDGDTAGRELKNPVPRTKAALLRGQKMFNTYCIVCHGSKGEGNGFVVPKFPQPPSLHSDKVKGWSDGRIYHVITTGQNLMPKYSLQIDPEDRWAIVNYVRVLQRALNPTDADLKETKR